MKANKDRAALYARISREDGETSQSLENQREFLLSYAKSMGFYVAGVYSDDGYSGTNFERPAFKQLICDIEAGKIDIVITKDLSRLGRDYIGTGEFIERFFPSRKIRFIAVNDHLDSYRGVDKMAPFLYVFNDFYPRDISDKVRAVLNHKRISGDFIGSFAPYGYKKDLTNNNKLVIDDTAAETVRIIFDVYLKTTSVSEVIRQLAALNIPPPSVYSGRAQGRKTAQIGRNMIWNAPMVRRILTNPTYAGHLTQNRSRKLGVKINRQIAVSRDEWITVLNTHEPVVSQEVFDRVNELMATKTARRNKSGDCHLLSGLVFCADCGMPMTFQKDGGNRRYMVCSSSRRTGAQKTCFSHCIREDHVERLTAELLRSLCANVFTDAELESLIAAALDRNRGNHTGKNALTQKLNENRLLRYRLYHDLVSGKMEEIEYKALYRLAEQDRARLASELERCGDGEKPPDTDSLKKELISLLQFSPPDRAALLRLIGKILIHADKTVEFFLSFQDPGQHTQEQSAALSS
ncbi:MAG: recombinase family protein [Clostridiales bacterium]|nr:recombinase family protein [Clostridiales bacterium]